MKPTTFLPAARDDLHQAATFYESRRSGLGSDFEAVIAEAIERIQQNPLTGFPSDHMTRTLTVRRFPFGIVFREYPDQILVVAVAHHSRRENYWADRIEDEFTEENESP